jgi:hypothetical protein
MGMKYECVVQSEALLGRTMMGETKKTAGKLVIIYTI